MISIPERAKDALKDGRGLKRMRFKVLKDNGTTDFLIDNDTLVYESVKFDERMCSGDQLKFGLCEGSSLEFQYFDLPNITGRQLECYVDVNYKAAAPGWSLETLLTNQKNIYTISDPAAYELIIPAYGAFDPISLKYTQNGEYHETTLIVTTPTTYDLGELSANDTIEISAYNFEIELQKYSYYKWQSIELGFFTVDKCSRQASTGIRKVTAYNKLKSEYLDKTIDVSSLESDTSDPDMISFKCITDEMLKDYAFISVDRSVEWVMESELELSVNIPTFELIQESGVTFYPSIMLTNPSSSHHDAYLIKGNALNNTYRYVVLHPENLADLFDDAVSNIKSFFEEQVTSGSAYWETNKGTILKYASMHVVFDDGKEAYFAGDDLLEETPSAATITYRKMADMMYLLGVTTDTSINAFELMIPSIYMWTSHSRQGYPDRMWTNPAKFDSSQYAIGYMLLDDNAEDIIINKNTMPDATLRELQSAIFEMRCQYGKLSRTDDLFYGAELNNTRILPAASLYPADDLYPGGISESGDKSAYSKLWTDTGVPYKFRYLIITYKGLDENNVPKDMILQRTVNANGNVDYNMSSNWIFKNLIWTEEDVEDYADAMVTKMQNVSWIPFEMWAAGLPYLETGDELEITTPEGTFTSYILQRQLSGIQNLQDTFINGTLDVF